MTEQDKVDVKEIVDTAIQAAFAAAIPKIVGQTVEQSIAQLVPQVVAQTVQQSIAQLVPQVVAQTVPQMVEQTVPRTVELTLAGTRAIMQEMWRDLSAAIRGAEERLSKKIDTVVDNLKRVDRNTRKAQLRLEPLELDQGDKDEQLEDHEERLRRLEDLVGIKPDP